MCYNLNWKNIKLPSKDKIISLEKANSIVFQKLGFDKEYIKYKNVKEKDSKEEIKLAYLFDSIPGAIDANSGELIDSMGKTIKEIKPIIFNDIKGSPSEENIKILSDLRIIDDETVNFNPYDYILQKDFIKYMVRSLEPYFVLTNEDSYDEYYKIAIDRKLISEKEKNINGNVSKEFAAKIAVRALNLGYTAELS
ncbi:MAG TPA: peptidase M4, partial [Clostridiaceae bacterium]|nr:peptidase M4 [Clostridiaceae bacterium]